MGFRIIIAIVFLAFSCCILSLNSAGGTIDIIHQRAEVVGKAVVKGILTETSINDIILQSGEPQNQNFLITCYYDVPRNNRSLMPEEVDGSLCTHIIVGFSGVVNGVITPSSPDDVKMYKKMTDLKSKYPSLKVMLTVGGGGNNNGFSKAVSSQENRNKFIDSVIKLLTEYNFDGLDVDWEFPVWNDYTPSDKENFIYFLRDLKALSKKRFNLTRDRFLLSVAVAAPKGIIDSSYDVPNMAKYVDFINLMSYDYHDYFWYYPFTGHNSPLFRRQIETAYFGTLNTNWSSYYWAQLGMPKSKIMVGIPTYSHTFKLLDPKFHDFDAPAVGFGIGGGEMTYPEMCEFLQQGGISVFDEESQVPYAYKDFDWIAYDDYRSVAAKANWLKSQGFGGAMTFNLNSDDWSATCNGITTFPLHRIIHKILRS